MDERAFAVFWLEEGGTALFVIRSPLNIINRKKKFLLLAVRFV